MTTETPKRLAATLEHRPTSPSQMVAFTAALHPRRVDLVRIGPTDDGGYLLPDVLDGIEACFSPGVGTCSDFELACAERGMQVFLADATVDGPAADEGGVAGVDGGRNADWRPEAAGAPSRSAACAA